MTVTSSQPDPGDTLVARAALVDRCRALAARHGPEPVVGAVIASVARQLGHHRFLDLEADTSSRTVQDLAEQVALPLTLAAAETPGWVYEGLLEPSDRHRTGAYYTPADIARRLVERTLEGLDPRAATVCDPAMGGGAFLLAAADYLHAVGLSPHAAVEHVWGADLDPVAARVARDGLRLWCATHSGTAPTVLLVDHLVVGDTLTEGLGLWPNVNRGFDAVIGNPPFQSQLRATTARTAQRTAALRRRLPAASGVYVDTAALFWGVAQTLIRPDRGRIALIVPESLLAARDAAVARAALADDLHLRHLWVADGHLFGAQVRVCAPIFDADPGVGSHPISRSRGATFVPAAPLARSEVPTGADRWGRLLSDLRGVPTVHLAAPAKPDGALSPVTLGDRDPPVTLGDVAEVTAGFRDQYYGIAPHVSDDPDDEWNAGHLRLVTSGLIDVLGCGWGQRPATYQHRRWAAPKIDLEALIASDPGLARWASRLAVPKVVVATQTRVVEGAVDVSGSWYPCTPTIAVVPGTIDVWACAALLAAPPVSAWLHGEVAGSGLSSGHLRLGAGLLRRVPLPSDASAWTEAADLVRRLVLAPVRSPADVLAVGEAMAVAYRSDPAVVAWWRQQVPELRCLP